MGAGLPPVPPGGWPSAPIPCYVTPEAR